MSNSSHIWSHCRRNAATIFTFIGLVSCLLYTSDTSCWPPIRKLHHHDSPPIIISSEWQPSVNNTTKSDFTTERTMPAVITLIENITRHTKRNTTPLESTSAIKQTPAPLPRESSEITTIIKRAPSKPPSKKMHQSSAPIIISDLSPWQP
eukprot:PhM_4_TR1315/c1_g2_i1/m.52888